MSSDDWANNWSFNTEPAIDAPHDHAVRFLNRLAPDGRICFQSFDDAKQGRGELARIFHGSLRQHWRELKRLNDQGAGIFVAVNRTDGKGRKEGNIVTVRALLLDLDGSPLEPVLAVKPKPHLVTETSAGRYHCLYLVDDCPLADFTGWQQVLAARFSGDTSIIDLARCCRLPGYWHVKAKPQLSRLLCEHFAPVYSMAEIAAGLGLQRRDPETRPTAAPAPATYDLNSFCYDALIEACTAIIGAPDGKQGDTLNCEAFTMGTLVENFHLPPTAAIKALVDAGLRMTTYDRRRPWHERDIRHTVERAFSHGQRTPRPRSH